MHGRVKLPGQAHSLCIHSSRIFLGMESGSVLVFLILGKGDIVQQKVQFYDQRWQYNLKILVDTL